jgi:hypothetical protein
MSESKKSSNFLGTCSMGSLGQEIDANTIESQRDKLAQGYKRRLIELRTWAVHKPQVDFFTFCSLFQHALATASIP